MTVLDKLPRPPVLQQQLVQQQPHGLSPAALTHLLAQQASMVSAHKTTRIRYIFQKLMADIIRVNCILAKYTLRKEIF